MATATVAIMFVYSSLLGAVALACMAISAGLRRIWYQPLQRATEEQIVRAARQQSHFLETLRGVKTIKLFVGQDTRRARWLSLLVEQINAELCAQKRILWYQQLNGFLVGVEGILIIWLGARMVIDGQFTVGMLMAFSAYKGQFDGRVGSLIDKCFEVQTLRLHGDRLADIVFEQPEHRTNARHVAGEEENLVANIEFDSVGFHYAEGEPAVLCDISFSVAAGESVALVGPSGCGKTTLVNLLLGVLKPTAGQVRIGGVDADRLGLDRLRSLFGTVLQDDVLFAGSIADNISFFDPNADTNWIAECARQAAVHADIIAMPLAYNTLVGDMGCVLSGGQKQRLLLARALYKRPKILVLDEATSHLDLQREQEVNAAISLLGITRIMVAHRPETIASAARVLVLGGGRLVVDQPTTISVGGTMRSVTDAALSSGAPTASAASAANTVPTAPSSTVAGERDE